MKPNTCHAGQALLPGTHTTPRISGALLPVTTAAAEGSFATQFANRETGQSYTVRSCMENGNGECKLPQTVEHGEPPRKRQRTEEGTAPAGLLPQPFVPAPASAAAADPWADPRKTSMCASYGAALEPLHRPGLSPQVRLQKLEVFRTTCHRLINESWQWLRHCPSGRHPVRRSEERARPPPQAPSPQSGRLSLAGLADPPPDHPSRPQWFPSLFLQLSPPSPPPSPRWLAMRRTSTVPRRRHSDPCLAATPAMNSSEPNHATHHP